MCLSFGGKAIGLFRVPVEPHAQMGFVFLIAVAQTVRGAWYIDAVKMVGLVYVTAHNHQVSNAKVPLLTVLVQMVNLRQLKPKHPVHDDDIHRRELFSIIFVWTSSHVWSVVGCHSSGIYNTFSPKRD